MELPKKYPEKRKKAFERMVGQLLAKTGKDFRGGTRESLLEALEGKRLRTQTKWGVAELPELLPMIREERWSPGQALEWHAHYRKREANREAGKRKPSAGDLVEYLVLVTDVPLRGVADAREALKAARRGSGGASPVLVLAPDMGELDAGEALKRFEKLSSKEKMRVTKRANRKIKVKEKELMEELEATGRLGQIICNCCGEAVACPTCTNDRLRGWELKKGSAALCYECGTLFVCDTGEVLSRLDGPKEMWGARALAQIASMGR